MSTFAIDYFEDEEQPTTCKDCLEPSFAIDYYEHCTTCPVSVAANKQYAAEQERIKKADAEFDALMAKDTRKAKRVERNGEIWYLYE